MTLLKGCFHVVESWEKVFEEVYFTREDGKVSFTRNGKTCEAVVARLHRRTKNGKGLQEFGKSNVRRGEESIAGQEWGLLDSGLRKYVTCLSEWSTWKWGFKGCAPTILLRTALLTGTGT